MSEVTLGLSDEDRAALDLMKAQKAEKDLANARKQRLEEFKNGEATKEYAKELLAHGLQADLDANPHLLDSTETLTCLAKMISSATNAPASFREARANNLAFATISDMFFLMVRLRWLRC